MDYHSFTASVNSISPLAKPKSKVVYYRNSSTSKGDFLFQRIVVAAYLSKINANNNKLVLAMCMLESNLTKERKYILVRILLTMCFNYERRYILYDSSQPLKCEDGSFNYNAIIYEWTDREMRQYTCKPEVEINVEGIEELYNETMIYLGKRFDPKKGFDRQTDPHVSFKDLEKFQTDYLQSHEDWERDDASKNNKSSAIPARQSARVETQAVLKLSRQVLLLILLKFYCT